MWYALSCDPPSSKRNVSEFQPAAHLSGTPPHSQARTLKTCSVGPSRWRCCPLTLDSHSTSLLSLPSLRHSLFPCSHGPPPPKNCRHANYSGLCRCKCSCSPKGLPREVAVAQRNQQDWRPPKPNPKTAGGCSFPQLALQGECRVDWMILGSVSGIRGSLF